MAEARVPVAMVAVAMVVAGRAAVTRKGGRAWGCVARQEATTATSPNRRGRGIIGSPEPTLRRAVAPHINMPARCLLIR